MIRKITLIFLICSFLASCGKKEYPEYNDTEKKAEMKIILSNKA